MKAEIELQGKLGLIAGESGRYSMHPFTSDQLFVIGLLLESQKKEWQREAIKPKMKAETTNIVEELINKLYESKVLHDYKDGKIDYRKVREFIVGLNEATESQKQKDFKRGFIQGFYHAKNKDWNEPLTAYEHYLTQQK